MDDDIFAQLSSLVNDKPSYVNTATGFGGTTFIADSTNSGSQPGASGSSDENMFEFDDMVVPVIKPQKSTDSKKRIVVIDDDFSTLDLMKIYLQRDYEYMPFDNPKNAIFYLNGNIPDLIFIDCYLNVMNTRRLLDIIRTYKEISNVPIIYLAEPSEESAIKSKLPEGVVDIISRPVKRADLQRILDTHITEDNDSESDTPISHDII